MGVLEHGGARGKMNSKKRHALECIPFLLLWSLFLQSLRTVADVQAVRMVSSWGASTKTFRVAMEACAALYRYSLETNKKKPVQVDDKWQLINLNPDDVTKFAKQLLYHSVCLVPGM